MKKRIPLLAAFFVPLLIACIVCIDHEVFPFGEQCVLQVDMYHQYCPFFTELMDKIKTGGSPFYSWNIGLGADFVSLYAYYLASPLNWLLLLWPRDYVIEFMTVLVLFKIALCGLTFAYYLKEHFKTNHFAIGIFGTAYALSAFMAAYSWDIMWTDCMVLAPLVILGLERLIKEGRPLLYYVTLALSILSNYYISIMICIFLVLWFLTCWLEDRRTGIRAWFRFAGYSLLAGGTGAILIIPTAIVLGKSGAQGISFPESMEWYFNIVAELARHFVTTEAYMGQNHWPNIYCGVFVLVFFVLFILNRRIPWKRKVSRTVLVILFVLSFANNMLDFVWHGLHFPTSLPGRQSFLYIFLLLVISYESFFYLRGTRLWHILAAGVVNGAFLFGVYRFVLNGEIVSSGVDMDAFWATVVLLACYLLLLAVYLLGKAKIRQLMLGIGCFAMLGELTVNFDVTGLDTTSRTAYLQRRDDYGELIKIAEEKAKEEGTLFFRTEELERMTKNDAALYGYDSATQFSSLMNLEVSHFYQAVGMEGGKNFYCINGATPLLSAMLSVRYVLADNGLEENGLRTMIGQSGESWLYENNYVLPLGFVMPEEVASAWDEDKSGADDIQVQNELAYLLGAKSEMFVPVSSASEQGVSTIEAEEDGYYFATYEKTSVDNLTEEVDGGRSRNYTKVSHGYTLDLGYCEAGDTIKVKNSDNETVVLTAYRLDVSAFLAAYETLAAQPLELTEFTDDRLSGTVEIKEPGRMIFSIAKEDGWTLYVDGKKTEPETFGGAFISVYLDRGEHMVELRYETPGFYLGAAISGFCIAAFLILILIRKRQGCRL